MLSVWIVSCLWLCNRLWMYSTTLYRVYVRTRTCSFVRYSSSDSAVVQLFSRLKPLKIPTIFFLLLFRFAHSWNPQWRIIARARAHTHKMTVDGMMLLPYSFSIISLHAYGMWMLFVVHRLPLTILVRMRSMILRCGRCSW